MPYIIETYNTSETDDGTPVSKDVTRRAVATLDEAREVIEARYGHRTAILATARDTDLIGPLPDGTVIEVAYAHVTDPAMHAGWVDIYNRKHAQGA